MDVLLGRQGRGWNLLLVCVCMQSPGICFLCARGYKNAEIVHNPFKLSCFLKTWLNCFWVLAAFNLTFSLYEVIMWSLTIMQMKQVLFSTAWHIVAFKCNVKHCALLSFLLCSSYAHGYISTSYHIVVGHSFVLKASNCALVNMILPTIPFLSSKCLNDICLTGGRSSQRWCTSIGSWSKPYTAPTCHDHRHLVGRAEVVATAPPQKQMCEVLLPLLNSETSHV